MSTLLYTLVIPELKKDLQDQSITYTDKVEVVRPLKDTDGDITIDISEITTVKALFVQSTGPVTVEINTEDVEVTDILFISLAELTSLKISTAETTDISIEVAVFGV